MEDFSLKNVIFGLCALGSVSAFAVSTASLDYSCTLDGVIRNGSVLIDDKLVIGKASCMYFGKGPTLCFRFERHVLIDDIYLALRTANQLGSNLASNYISLGNIPFSEGGSSVNTISTGFLKSDDLTCTYSNVSWKHIRP